MLNDYATREMVQNILDGTTVPKKAENAVNADNATNAQSAAKLGNASAGSPNRACYFSGGVPKEGNPIPDVKYEHRFTYAVTESAMRAQFSFQFKLRSEPALTANTFAETIWNEISTYMSTPATDTEMKIPITGALWSSTGDFYVLNQITIAQSGSNYTITVGGMKSNGATGTFAIDITKGTLVDWVMT